jgi:hypothetical protein
MKKLTSFSIVCALMGLCCAQAQPAATSESGCQLTIELRDGSRVVGKSLEDSLSFHSATLGDMKLAWAGIRSIEYAADAGPARLTAANGDEFTVQLAPETLRVETGFGLTELPVKLIRSVKVSPPAKPSAAAGTDTARLTIELRDGSHVIGKSLEDTLNFHTAAMGDLKLAWPAIRSIEYAGANTEMARLTAANGDVYEVQFAVASLGVETSFGKTELPVKLIRSIRISAAVQAGPWPSELPSGLVALWSGEGDGSDSAGRNNAALTDVAFAEGKVGQAFSLNGTSSSIKIPASSALNVGEGPGLSILAWIKPSDVDQEHPIVEWNNGAGSWATQLHLSNVRWEGAFGPGELIANIVDTSGRWHPIGSASGAIVPNVFQHVALTYDKGSGVGMIYCNGVVLSRRNLGSFTPQTSYDLYLGRRPSPAGEAWRFAGLMDEIAIFNRALSASEIQAICTEQNHGEPLPPPPAPTPGVMRNGGTAGGPVFFQD